MLTVVKKLTGLTWDYFRTAAPEHVLQGTRMFRPFMSYQQSWIKHCYPGDQLDGANDSWFYLQKYMMPLIKLHASVFHLQGIDRLNLDSMQQPDFKAFQRVFAEISQGFTIEPVDQELSPMDYFTLISERRFPCIEKIRSHEELFCGNEPDFWHEAIGHIAPLCFKEVQEFYLEIADCLLSAKTKQQFHRQLTVAWTLMEYGFIKEQGQNKMFGAALVGSHLANIRYQQGIISVEPATRDSIIDSGFFDEDTPLPRTEGGQLRFFGLERLSIGQLLTE